MRKAIIAGNWKMNKTPAEAAALVNDLKPLVKDASCDVVVCVPAVDIAAVKAAAEGSNIHVGAENVHWAASGAYTGELSAEMLVACWRGIRHHRPQRAPSVFRRNRPDGQQARAGGCCGGA